MNVKIDTKEKFTVITPIDADIPANMTVELDDLLLNHFDKPNPHIIFNMKNITSIDRLIMERIVYIKEEFYHKNISSFVICEMSKDIEGLFRKNKLYGKLNVTPTESEAWDILQMEEIERELLRDFESEH